MVGLELMVAAKNGIERKQFGAIMMAFWSNLDGLDSVFF